MQIQVKGGPTTVRVVFVVIMVVLAVWLARAGHDLLTALMVSAAAVSATAAVKRPRFSGEAAA